MNSIQHLNPIIERTNDLPLGIAGPCSAESEEQQVKTAKALVDKNIHILRAGIWKPRTRPGTFEGVGKKGLAWLKTAKQETGLKTATEVANTYQIEEALKAEVDILWIGARTSVSPFAMQEIADALRGIDIPVLVKNPINPDLELWIGGLERIHQAGITRLGAIHRGFSCYGKSAFRNTPLWQIPIELKRRIPNLPVICDPSHICGSRDRIEEISQKALSLGLDGLMIESHIQPEKALSDAKQQLKPHKVVAMLRHLRTKEFEINKSGMVYALDALRGQIDVMDNDIIQALADRMKVSAEIGKHKKENHLPLLQSDRWQEVVEKTMLEGQNRGLTEGFVNTLLNAIHQESITHQEKVTNS